MNSSFTRSSRWLAPSMLAALLVLTGSAQAPANTQLPEPETTAANGPIQGAMVLFLIDRSAVEDRPLVLHIPSSTGQVGDVELDL